MVTSRPKNPLSLISLNATPKAVATIGDSVFYFGELGMQEVESAKLMTETLEKEGFSVERGISGFPTGFCATFGSGAPVIALHTEYDANPNNSQASGETEPKNITTLMALATAKAITAMPRSWCRAPLPPSGRWRTLA